MAKSKPEVINAVGGAILTIVGLLTAVGEMTDKLKDIHQKLAYIPPPFLWLVIAVVFLVGASLLWRGLSRKSRLLRPDVLLLDPGNPQHLKGRSDDVRRLCTDVIAHPLIFLDGESGAGKSALVHAGLLPALSRNDKTLLPLYLHSYSTDWYSGPEVQLARTLWHALTDEQRKKLGLNMQEDVRTQLWSISEPSLMARVQNELGRTPLLIFDQFDDYQALHRQQFLREGQWTTAGQLAAQNPFWSGIRDALQRNVIHCLFVTRSDISYGGLEAVRFVEPKPYYLERLAPAYIIALLEEIVTSQPDGKPVIAYPEAGWEALKNRLIHDLAYQDRILPVQASTALKGLINLPYLSISTYERAGRVEGLEAAYIEAGMASAAERSGLNQSTVLQILLHLVDQSNPEIPKTRVNRQSQLLSQFRLPEGQLQRALEVLEQKGLVRNRLGSEAEGEGYDKQWSLYHDYLARAALAVQRKANRWQLLLSEKQRTWEQAVGWRAKWKALLSPWQQGRMVLASMKGQIQLRGYYRYLGWSTSRLFLYLIVLGLLFGAWRQVLDWQAHQDARTILTSIRTAAGRSGWVPEDEGLRQLWRLTSGTQRLRNAFLNEALEDSSSHPALVNSLAYVSHALFGLNPQGKRRGAVLEQLSARLRDKPSTNRGIYLYALWSMHIYESAPKRFEKKIWQIIAEISLALITAIRDTTDFGQVRVLGEALGSLGAKLPPEQALENAKSLITTMRDFTEPERVLVLRELLGRLGEQLPPEQATELGKHILAVMRDTGDSEQRQVLGEVLGMLGEQLPPEQAAELGKHILAAMRDTTEPRLMGTLSEALSKLGAKLAPEQAMEGANLYLATMQELKNSEAVETLGEALGRLGEQLPPEQAAELGKHILAAMRDTTEPRLMGTLSEALSKLGTKLAPAQAVEGANLYLAAMRDPKKPWLVATLGEAFTATQLPLEQAVEGANLLLAAMWEPKNFEAVGTLGKALGKLGEQLPPEQAAELGKHILAAMRDTEDSEQRQVLGEALGQLSGKLPPEQAAELGKHILAAIREPENFEEIGTLGEVLGKLREQLPPEQVVEGANLLLAAMRDPKKRWFIEALGEALGSLGAKLPPEQASDLGMQITAVMRDMTDPMLVSTLGEALGSLAVKLPPETASEGARLLLAAMGKTMIPYAFHRLGEGLEKLTPIKDVNYRSAVELLKPPLAASIAQNSILKYLSRKAGQEFQDLESFVEWAQENGPTVDLESPPAIPEDLFSHRRDDSPYSR